MGSAFDLVYRRGPAPTLTSLDSPANVKARLRSRPDVVNDARRPGAWWIPHSGWLVTGVWRRPERTIVRMEHPSSPLPLWIETEEEVDAIILSILRRNGVLSWKKKYRVTSPKSAVEQS
jgi:hypothetical protein